ncbi:DeoR/GlpR family DNA-binding transcription regulator [Streptococcus sp. DD12]|uniref:DeoR/GlpR family DNA-binding transcription regulator n=1 Tax=Streptococcus sp. DD12 TaxID=1777880 RepID=UPI0007970B18|nr:DeoR/GlpR family DNA-binding transcription regulator [Streptococcus sp. DD12]KXT76276.1 Transcriptional repressor of the fructose operon, DeoR family [Streptococcus sp. DD12]
MLKSERKQIILDLLAEDSFVTLEQLTQRLKTSESTCRRDLDELAEAGLLHRVHGGAELVTSLQAELDNQAKSVKHVADKRALIASALATISPGDVIFIDAGTTTAMLIEALTVSNVTVVTNSIHHATLLVERGIQTHIIGGFVKQSTDASVGAMAMRQIDELHFDKAFIGINGVDSDSLTTPDPEEAVIKRSVIANAKVTYVLADQSKLGQTAFVKVAPITSVVLITNLTSSHLLTTIKEKTRVITV